MSNDEPPIEDGGIGSQEQQAAEFAAVDEAPVEAAGSKSPPEASPPGPNEGEVRSEGTKQNKTDVELTRTAVSEPGSDEAESERRPMSAESFERLRTWGQKNLQDNIDTRPPDSETVTFRSVTVAEIYVDQASDSLMTALTKIEWINFDFLDRIAEARKGDRYVSGNFTLFSMRPDDFFSPGGRYGVTDLPSGTERIYCEYYVLGPSTMAVVLTFVLTADDAMRMNVALREDAASELVSLGEMRYRMRTVPDVKRERIRGVQDEVIRRCLDWLKSRMPGTLSATTAEGLRPPTCALVSLADGKPFGTLAEYMTVLGLRQQPVVMKFVRRDFLFLVQPLDGPVQMAAFNESDAIGSGWLYDPERAPELFHEEISSLVIADGLNAALRSFEPRLRSIRADLNRLDIDEPAGTQVIGLRNRLLGLTREISTVSAEVTVFVNDALIVWADFSPLAPGRPNGDSSASLEITADRKRQQLRAVIQSLQAQESELRELILVTTSAVNETRTLKLNNALNRLTWVLVGLTIAVLVVAIVQLVQASSGTAVQTPSSPTATRTASSSPRSSHSLRAPATKTKALG